MPQMVAEKTVRRSSKEWALNDDVEQELADLFPLPVTAFEDYMLSDDRPAYPMSFFLELHLSGDLRREPFEESLKVALARHPLLTCIIKPGRLWGSKWVPSSLAPQFNWLDDEPLPDTLASQWIDIRQKPGFRLWVSHKIKSSRIVLQFHHAVTDGTGAIQFVGDLLALYGQRTTCPEESQPTLLKSNLARLRKRGDANPTRIGRLKVLRELIDQIWTITRNAPVLLAAPKPKDPTEQISDSASLSQRFPPYVSRILDAETVQELGIKSLRCGVSENDLYTAAMFLTIQQWNTQQGLDERGKHIGIGIPVSLRTPAHDNISAANVLSYKLLNFESELCQDAKKTLRQVHQQLDDALNSVERGLFTLGVEAMRSVPGVLKQVTNSSRCFSTVILANIGQVRRQLRARFPIKRGKCIAGNVTLESLMGAAPIRSRTRMATSLGSYAGQLYINMNCDPLFFSTQEAEQLIDLFVTNLKPPKSGEA